MSNLIVWDIETVPDLKGFAAANGHDGKGDEEIRAAMGDKFPKHIYHSIICIGALVAHREETGRWTVDALGAPHVGERSEKELIASLVDRIAALSPQLVTFNESSFDLPVLRYRALVHGVAARGSRRVSVFIGTLRMQLIYATCCPRLVHRPRQPYMNCPAGWVCRQTSMIGDWVFTGFPTQAQLD